MAQFYGMKVVARCLTKNSPSRFKNMQISLLTLLVLLLQTFSAMAQQPEVQSAARDAVEWRHHIHENPELSFEEYKTSNYVADLLASFGHIEILRPTKTSVVGILRGGKPGKTVGFRADMDALPVQEETGFSFASKTPGVSHACGHDMHTAMLLGTAKVLASMQKELPGTVYFIFQPGEEKSPGGALPIIKSGVLKGVDAIFGAHVMPNEPAGSIGILPAGAASSSSDGFFLTIQGKGSHGSMPQLGVDPIVTGSEIVMVLQTVVSRNATPGDMAVITVGKFQSGNAPNVIPDKAVLGASIRSVTPETRKLLEERTRSVIDHVCKANGAQYKLDYVLGYPSIQNNAALRELAKKAAVEAVGEKNVFDSPRIPASEDFSYYAQVAPTYFMTIGSGDGPANHNPGFKADDRAILNGIKAEVRIILDYLNSK